jgi:hypothetical protein
MRHMPRVAARGERVSLRNLGMGSLFPFWLISALLAWKALGHVSSQVLGNDAHAYWLTGHHSHLYEVAPAKLDAFLYSPAFAAVIWPFTHLTYHTFLALWILVEIATFAWLLAPLGWRWATPLLLLCTPVLSQGQIVGLLCISAVVGITHPAAWAFPLLTKISSGVGLVWFAVRGDWAAVTKALAATAAITAVSFVIAPHAWSEWFAFLFRHGGESGWVTYLRMTAAVAVTTIGARTNRPWLLAPAMWLASPVFVGIVGYSYLTAIPRLLLTRDTSLDAAVPTATALSLDPIR